MLGIPFGIRNPPQFGLPNWVYPDKMAFKQSEVLFRDYFSLPRAPSCRYIPANVSPLEHDQAGLGFPAFIYKNVGLCDIIEKPSYIKETTHGKIKIV